jgi:hypothetical protein
VLVLAASYLVSWFGLSLGCASPATRIFGADITREVEVVWKSDGRWRRGCDYELKLRDVRSDWSTTTCVGKEFWSLVRRGDVLHAKGKGSGLGIMLVEYTFPDRR